MPTVTNPDGIPYNVPLEINGKDLKKQLNIPPNKILTRKDKAGFETVVRNDDRVKVGEGDQFDQQTSFERGC